MRGYEGGQMPLIRRLPKVGFRRKSPLVYQIVSLESLKRFKEGTVIDASFLKSQGLIKSIHRPFKILGDGELKKPLTIQAVSFSKTALEKITHAGGKAEVISQGSLAITSQAQI
jgi:large subunit ribosomal protein L15